MQHMDVFFRKFLLLPLIIFSFGLATTPAFAFSGNWLVGMGAGGTKPYLQNSTTSVPNGSPVPAPYNLDTFSINNLSDTENLTVFGGYQWQRANSFLPYFSLVLRYDHLFSQHITGTVQEYGLPIFTNYTYSMKLTSDVVNVVGKFDLIRYKFILPYLSAGIGVAFNQINHYAEQPIPPVYPARISPNYGTKTNINFAYLLGAGFDFICTDNLWVTLGYQYMNLGKTNNSSPGSAAWSSGQLSFGRLTSQTLFGSFTFLF